MKFATKLKTLTLLGLTSLTLTAASSQADNGYGYYGSAPMPNPWYGVAPNANPWMQDHAARQARIAAAFKQRQVELDQRQDAQMQRILAGMEDGRLTGREAAGLLREHLDIANLERGFMADGRLGPNELLNLEQRLAEAGRHITFEQNDRERTDTKNRPEERERPGNMGRPGDFGRH